jgi:hypothetical protein
MTSREIQFTFAGDAGGNLPGESALGKFCRPISCDTPTSGLAEQADLTDLLAGDRFTSSQMYR